MDVTGNSSSKLKVEMFNLFSLCMKDEWKMKVPESLVVNAHRAKPWLFHSSALGLI